MSSEFAEFLFSFACNKLETSPQLDLRQQLLHSNLIRHILLVHQPSTVSSPDDNSSSAATSSSPLSPDLTPVSHSHQRDQRPFSIQQDPTTTTTTTASAQHQLSSSSQAQANTPYGSVWSPFSFDDELDRIDLANHQQDSDVDMEEQGENNINNSSSHHFDLSSSSSGMVFDDSDYSFFYQPSPFQHQHEQQQQQHLSFHQLHQIQLQYPLQQHQQQMLDEDQEYLYEASQAQEDWLDAVLEDLIDDDQDDDEEEDDDNVGDVSSPEYRGVDTDSDSDAEEYLRDTFEDDVKRRQLSDPRQSFDPHPCLLQFNPANEKGSTAIASAPTALPLAACLSPSSLPPTSPQTANTHTATPTTAVSATSSSSTTTAAITPSPSSRFLARGDILDQDPTLHPLNPINNSNHHASRSLDAMDEAYYRPCPPCLGFHCSSSARSSSTPSSYSQGEDSLREERFAQLAKELLTSTYLQHQQLQQQTHHHQYDAGPMVYEPDQATLSASPALLKALKDPLSYRDPSSAPSSSPSKLSLRKSLWLESSSSACD